MVEILTLLFGLLKSTVAGWQKIQQAKQERELAATNNEARLLADTQTNNAAWQIEALRHSDRWLRRISFTIFTAPFVVALISPESVRNYFIIALSVIPPWYVKGYLGIVGSVWGVAELKNAIPAIINQIKPWKNPDLSE